MPDTTPIETLQALLSLDAETGTLTWKPRPLSMFHDNAHRDAAHTWAWWNTKYAGKPALTAVGRRGARSGIILGVRCYAHRVVFALHHGHWPVGDLDHRDGDSSNNRPENLREATSQQNRWNTLISRGASRFSGVSWNTQKAKWRATFYQPDGKPKHIGSFDDEEAAARAWDAEARKWRGEFAKLNFP